LEQHTPKQSQDSSSPINLRGILLPFTTPFTTAEEVDTDAVKFNLDYWNKTGVAGYVALGSTGERVNLNEQEFLKIVEIARENVPSNLTFIVGVGQQSTRQTIQEILNVARAGADAVLAITPNFYRAAITQAVLIKHFNAIADASPVPVILYSMPDLTGIVIEPATAAELSRHENIIGMKDSAAEIHRFRETLLNVSDEFELLTGNGTMLFDALSAGARGGILAVGCIAARQCLTIYHDFMKGNRDAAAALQQKLTPLALAVTKRYGIGGLKVAMDMCSLKGGAVRAPLQRPDKIAEEEIATLLAAALETSQEDQSFAGAIRK